MNPITNILEENDLNLDNFEYLADIYLIHFIFLIKNNDLSEDETIDQVYSIFFRILSIEVFIIIIAYFIFIL